ncbi:hypothetical protein [Cochlodiniinecator piscidefendens]|uniref:hypothetical protein n=1 Tax=Cochlodiniinecator piscidefendens TaxID=2715756 RepID=UPI00140969D0|nr:hypothetical protein [Cochlodiniinecator piscidefendens]
MSFIRPELRDAMWRWRESVQGGGVIALGVWVFLSSRGWVVWLGLLLIILGCALVSAGIIRGRLRSFRNGPGVIEVVERQLTYFSPIGGSAVSLDDVTKIELQGSGVSIFWCFHVPGQAPLRIPATAQGAEQLLDALASFSGVNYDNIVKASQTSDHHLFLIWKKGD